MICSFKLPYQFVVPIWCQKCKRRSSRLSSEFVVPIWCHKLYKMFFKTTFWYCCSHMMPQIVWDAFLDYLLRLFSPRDFINYMRRTSRLPSDFDVHMWSHILYETLFCSSFSVCCPHMMPQIVWDPLQDYLLSLLPPYDGKNFMRRFSRLPFEFVCPYMIPHIVWDDLLD